MTLLQCFDAELLAE